MEIVELNSEYITLQQLLKLKDIISSGGEVKYYLATHKVFVNNDLEQRRGRKLYSGDVVKVNEKEYLIK